MAEEKKKKIDRAAVHRVNVTTIRCTICMKKFGQRKVFKHQGKYYHEDCYQGLRDSRHDNYRGIKQKDKRPPMRGV